MTRRLAARSLGARTARLLVLASAALAASCARPAPHDGGRLHVEAPTARVLASGAGALYLRIVNDGSTADRLDDVDSPAVADAQLHEVVRDGETTSMRTVPGGFAIPAHATIVLERGGKHVMFFGVKDAAATAHLPVTLHFAHAGAIAIDAPVLHGIDMGTR